MARSQPLGKTKRQLPKQKRALTPSQEKSGPLLPSLKTITVAPPAASGASAVRSRAWPWPWRKAAATVTTAAAAGALGLAVAATYGARARATPQVVLQYAPIQSLVPTGNAVFSSLSWPCRTLRDRKWYIEKTPYSVSWRLCIPDSGQDAKTQDMPLCIEFGFLLPHDMSMRVFSSDDAPVLSNKIRDGRQEQHLRPEVYKEIMREVIASLRVQARWIMDGKPLQDLTVMVPRDLLQSMNPRWLPPKQGASYMHDMSVQDFASLLFAH